jgi:hypothetical protein
MFHTYAANVYLDVVYVCNGLKVFLGVFASVFNVCCKYFSCFKCMLQVFSTYVASISVVLNVCCKCSI